MGRVSACIPAHSKRLMQLERKAVSLLHRFDFVDFVQQFMASLVPLKHSTENLNSLIAMRSKKYFNRRIALGRLDAEAKHPQAFYVLNLSI